MPMTTVTKITGAVTVLMSCRNASASHFESVAGPGATSPNTIPAPIAIRTQNHSCRFIASSPLVSLLRGGPPRTNAKVRAAPGAVALVVVVVVVVKRSADAGAQPRGAPAGPPAHGGRRHRRGRRADHRAGRPR